MKKENIVPLSIKIACISAIIVLLSLIPIKIIEERQFKKFDFKINNREYIVEAKDYSVSGNTVTFFVDNNLSTFVVSNGGKYDISKIETLKNSDVQNLTVKRIK